MIGMLKIMTLGAMGLGLVLGQARGCEDCYPSYASLQIISEPAGASVYTPDGKYWGDTGGTLRMDREIPCAAAARTGGSTTDSMTITLRKQGYQDAVQTLYVDYKWASQDAAAQHPEIVKVVMQKIGP